ncbi:hypothetical protein [Boseongicola aestuarii]|uniref:Uncharacterized protein n=1 Tax=Boseongicola aestuarii TaxID=1470561 RepID=A0A238IY79_9RHOB|nr:hypothetical protein [Boseongicola aestuarii]SMX23367.1 hypothetical protein BOA8489_01473 [Boseongicola aestuarii]
MGKETKHEIVTAKRTAPKLVTKGDSNVTIHPVDESQLQALYGVKTTEAADLLLRLALNAFGKNGLEYIDLMPAMAVELEPRDAVEAMLVTQMTATHFALCSMSQKGLHAACPDVREGYERSMTRLSRTFLAQMDGLKKYRAKAQQTVRVERVTVNEGGQAIVGSVSHEGEGHGKK